VPHLGSVGSPQSPESVAAATATAALFGSVGRLVAWMTNHWQCWCRWVVSREQTVIVPTDRSLPSGAAFISSAIAIYPHLIHGSIIAVAVLCYAAVTELVR